jgi:hypothetical protein
MITTPVCLLIKASSLSVLLSFFTTPSSTLILKEEREKALVGAIRPPKGRPECLMFLSTRADQKGPFPVSDGVICITRVCVFSRMMMTTLIYLHIRVSSSSLLPSFLTIPSSTLTPIQKVFTINLWTVVLHPLKSRGDDACFCPLEPTEKSFLNHHGFLVCRRHMYRYLLDPPTVLQQRV